MQQHNITNPNTGLPVFSKARHWAKIHPTVFPSVDSVSNVKNVTKTVATVEVWSKGLMPPGTALI